MVVLWSDQLGDFQYWQISVPRVHPMTLARELSNGLRLYKPDNTARIDQMCVNDV